MKKIYILMLLLSVMTIVSAQNKMTIKTTNGKTVEISCDGVMPAEIQVEGDKVTFKMSTANSVTETKKADSTITSAIKLSEKITEFDDEHADSIDTFVPVEDTNDLVENADSISSESSLEPSIASITNSLAEEFVPEYAQFNKDHLNDKPSSEKEVVKEFAKTFINEDAVETADFIGSLFSGLRFTKDTSFVAKYEQRKPQKKWIAYDILELSGSFGRNFEGVSDAVAEKIDEKDYGDDTQNEHKFGAAMKYSRVYLLGSEVNGKWQPSPIGFGLSWGGLFDYSYEKDQGSYFSAMAKGGIQIGNDIAIGVDVLLGGGITPYNTFYTNELNHSLLNKSALCFKYGAQVWGSLNFSKNTYTAAYARYICSVKPNSAFSELPSNWELVVEDFDPSCWTIGLAVGYKFGAPQEPSTDKRLQASFNTGYQFVGAQKGMLCSAEIERFTQISHSTYLNYGLSVEQLFGQEDYKNKYVSVLFSAGFKVNQPENRWFWSSKLYAGVGDYDVEVLGNRGTHKLQNATKKLCVKAALQLSGGFKLGKLSEIFASCRFGYHLGNHINVDGFDSYTYKNLRGVEGDARLGYRYTF